MLGYALLPTSYALKSNQRDTPLRFPSKSVDETPLSVYNSEYHI